MSEASPIRIIDEGTQRERAPPSYSDSYKFYNQHWHKHRDFGGGGYIPFIRLLIVVFTPPVRPKSNREGTPSLYNGKGVTFVGHARTACSSVTKQSTWIYMYTIHCNMKQRSRTWIDLSKGMSVGTVFISRTIDEPPESMAISSGIFCKVT